MPLLPGFRFGPSEVLTPLGAGGMGEVHRARDTQLQRDVAVKVLPELLASDPERLARHALDGRLMSAAMRIPSDGQTIEAAAPVPLFAAGVGAAFQRLSGPQYMVAVEGKRFLMNRLTEETFTSPITVILNWKPPSR